MKLTILALLFSAALFAADATGKWTGTFTLTKDDGQARAKPALLILKQDGDKLTGSGGPDESEQHPIVKGKVDGNRLTFEVAAGDSTIAFDVVLEGDQIKGDMKKTGTAETAKLDVKRVAN